MTVAFAAILIAQFDISFTTLSNKASMNVIIKKDEIMRKMDRARHVFGGVLQKCPCVSVDILFSTTPVYMQRGSGRNSQIVGRNLDV